MSLQTHAAREDLAFMRTLLEDEGARRQRLTGAVFLAGGLIYGVQAVVQWTMLVGLVRTPPGFGLMAGFGPTLVFLAVLAWLIWRNRGAVRGGGTARAVDTVFATTGSTNLVMLALFSLVAVQRHSLMIWELYPAVVFALQGGAWLVAYSLRRRIWRLAVALGWFATAIGLGLTLASSAYLLVAGLGLLAWMAVPGAVMLRLAGPATPTP